MSLFTRLKEKRNKNAVNTPRNIRDYISLADSYAGKEATSFTAIDMIANAISMLGFGVYDVKSGEKKEKHWLYEVFAQPNLDETKSFFIYQIVKDWFSGGCFIYLFKNEEGKIISFFRLNPSAVNVSRDPVTNAKKYSYNGMTYYSDRILHIPCKYGYNGLRGGSIYSEVPQIFNTAIQLNNYVQNTFSQNLGKRLVIDTTEAYQDLTDDEKDQLENKLVYKYGGVKNAGRPIVMSGGIKFSSIDTGTASNQASELTDNREFQLNMISQLFHIPKDALNGNVPNDIENYLMLFSIFSVQPVAVIFEEYFNLLIPPEERNKYHFEFNFNSIMKTSLTKRVDAYSKQLMNGQLTINEIRAKENLPEIDSEAANTLVIPSNLMPVRDDIFDAYMASAKEKLKKVNDSSDLNNSDSTGIGDDKK